MSILLKLREALERYPQKELLITPESDHTYGSFVHCTRHIRKQLQNNGFNPGNRVAIYSEAYDEFFAAMFAIWLSGGVMIPLNTSINHDDLRVILKMSSPDFILAGRVNDCPAFPDSVKPISIEIDPKAEDSDINESVIDLNAISMIMFTSGTTGIPKGVCHTQRAISDNVFLTNQTVGLKNTDRVFINTPPYYMSAICHFMACIAAGGTLVAKKGFYFGQDLLNELNQSGCTGFGGSPVHLIRVTSPLTDPIEPGTLRLWISSGDHLPVHVIDKMKKVLPSVELFVMYGLTEVAGRLCVLSPEELLNKTGSVGRPFNNMTLSVLDENNQEVPPDQVGEIFVNGPLLMKGYLSDIEKEASSFTCWGFQTGDFGYKDEDGYLWIEGRKDDIFKRGGEKVSLVLIRDRFLELGKFEDAVVLPLDDEIMGKSPAIFYVLKEGCTIKQKEITRALKKELPPSFLPSRYIPLKRMPRTLSGKILKKELYRLLESLSR